MRLRQWLSRKWLRHDQTDISRAYHRLFATPDGQVVLQHLMDSVYCQVIETHDALALATHNGRRSVVHELLQLLDQAESPHKYQITVEETWNPMAQR